MCKLERERKGGVFVRESFTLERGERMKKQVRGLKKSKKFKVNYGQRKIGPIDNTCQNSGIK